MTLDSLVESESKSYARGELACVGKLLFASILSLLFVSRVESEVSPGSRGEVSIVVGDSLAESDSKSRASLPCVVLCRSMVGGARMGSESCCVCV